MVGITIYVVSTNNLISKPFYYKGAPRVVVTATQQILSAGGTELLPVLTCSVVDNDSSDLLNQLRWVKGSKELAFTQETGTVTFDTASIDSTFSEESHFGTYRCEALSSQDKTEESIHIAERGIHTNSFCR